VGLEIRAGLSGRTSRTVYRASKAVDLPPFAIAPLDSVEKLGRLFARKHHADVPGRNPRRPGGVEFVALGKRRALLESTIRSAIAGAEQRRRFDDEGPVQSTVQIVVGEPPQGHAGFGWLPTRAGGAIM